MALYKLEVYFLKKKRRVSSLVTARPKPVLDVTAELLKDTSQTLRAKIWNLPTASNKCCPCMRLKLISSCGALLLHHYTLPVFKADVIASCLVCSPPSLSVLGFLKIYCLMLKDLLRKQLWVWMVLKMFLYSCHQEALPQLFVWASTLGDAVLTTRWRCSPGGREE